MCRKCIMHGRDEKHLCFTVKSERKLLPGKTRFKREDNIEMKSSIFWYIMSCSLLKVYRRFGGTCRTRLQQLCLLPASCWFLVRLILRPWRWRRHVPPKHRLIFNGLHDVISQKIEFFILILSPPLNLGFPEDAIPQILHNIKMDHKEMGGMIWTGFNCSDRNQLRFHVNLRIP
jgi:hypothetical protein